MPHETVSSQSEPIQPADPAMAARLAVNRTGRLTAQQQRLLVGAGVFSLVLFLCPLALIIQAGAVLLIENPPGVTLFGVIFTVLGVLFLVFFSGLVGVNVVSFLPDAFSRQPVRYARGPLRIHPSSRERRELPFSFIVDDYSFAPFVPPPAIKLRTNAPYIVYYAARSRIFLSMAALDAPDAAEWEPQFKTPDTEQSTR